ncbi:344_t:CDS:2, partial [Funneliformis geosporum]
QQTYEDNQAGVDNLKNELAQKISEEEYCQIIVDTIEKNMTKYDIKEQELEPEIKADLAKLKSKEIKDNNQINEVEKKIAKSVGQKGSEKKLNHILQEAQEALKLGNKSKIKAVKGKLYNFLASTDIYEKSLLSQKGEDFPNEQCCIDYFKKSRWNENIISPYDPTSKVYELSDGWYKCKNTGKRFNVKTGTLVKYIKVTQKTAWFMAQRLRRAFEHPNFKGLLDGFVEIDETFIGGKNKNRHWDKKVPNSQGRSFNHRAKQYVSVENTLKDMSMNLSFVLTLGITAISIAGFELPCYVLEDGARVLSGRGMANALKM